jgi:hypothetical protein
MAAPPAPSPKSMSEIKSKLLNPSLTSHFECYFNPPKKVQDWAENKQLAGAGSAYEWDTISIHCSEASLPGSSFVTNEVNNDFTGVTERLAYRRLYDDRADFTFYVDHDYKVIRFFENWLSYISNEQISGFVSPDYFYRMNYPENYRSESIYIKKFERDYNGNYLQYQFLQAYPISINSMPVSYDSSSILKCTVSFTYTRYFVTTQQGMVEQEPKEPKPPTTPEYYGPGLPGEQANELRKAYLEDLVVRYQNIPGFNPQ